MCLFRPTFAAAATAMCLIAGLAGARTALAQEPLQITKASIGFGGKSKAGFWNPIWLSLQAGPQGAKGSLELVIPDGDQVPVVFAGGSQARLDLAANQQKTVLLYAKTGPIAAPITVRLVNDQGIVWSRDLRGFLEPAILSTQELIVGIGPDVGLAAAQAAIKRPAAIAVVTSQVATPEELPDQWYGYDGVDCLVLTTSDRSVLDQMTPPQQQALAQWVELGGRLLILVGANGEQILAAGSPWSKLIPGTLADVAPLRDGGGLKEFTAAELPIDDEVFQRNRPQVTLLANPTGRVLVEEGSAIAANRPLVVHAPYGLGQVTFLGLDLDHPSLARWRGRTSLLTQLLQAGRDHRDQQDVETRRSVTHLGYDDLIGQLRAALDQFPGVTMVNFTTVSMLTIVYLLLIGPGDYFLLSRLGWPRHWTWLTFPAMAALIGGAAWLIAGQSHGTRLRTNQVEFVDVDLSRQVARGTVWTHVYSPTPVQLNADLRLAPPKGIEAPAGWLAWQGLPGDSIGGLGSRQVALVAADPYRVREPGPQPGIDDLPVPGASSKSLAGRWWASTKLEAKPQLHVDPFGLLAGEFQQPLPIELTECLLVHGEKLYRLGTLAPEQTVLLEGLPPLHLEARLTQRQLIGSQDVVKSWEQASTDIPRIAQMVMFHEAARGSRYTGLTHRYQPTLDLTDQVRLGRAVLVGRAASSASSLQSDNQPLATGDDSQTWTWYRILLPVGAAPPDKNDS